MKKVFLFATAALLFSGASFAGTHNGKKKGKGKSCCSKSSKCTKSEKSKTVNL